MMWIMCECRTWMLKKWVSDKSGLVCFYYDYCPKCSPEEKRLTNEHTKTQ